MGIFRNIETADGSLGWSYGQFSYFTDLVNENNMEDEDVDDVDIFLRFATGKIKKESLSDVYREAFDFPDEFEFDEFDDNEVPWELCGQAEPRLRKIVQSLVGYEGIDMAITLCDKMKQCAETKTNLKK